ncbi:putative 39S ribosomal protein L1, mitochondrial [Hypsibius exemplaris]|uniref:39S ribosomal protein L1, mitochondrial n=1 Tax=Hypsibius exemplaris TaxID=2072580 RepID=A0A9X6NJJ6_HYPEX|nr:putative 39S ribosomal protein L1, mitochondrial [Hypsibius exemplaris]
MLQGCLTALRQQVWPTFAGGPVFQVAIRTAKRKHLRIAARKKRTTENKAKEEVKEKVWVPYKLRLLQNAKPKAREENDPLLKSTPLDDVWLARYYHRRVCTVREALSFHRELLHPTVLDAPESPVKLNLELNMRLEKDSKFLSEVKGLVLLPFAEERTSFRSVVAICKNLEDQQKAVDAGADVAGHLNVITAIEKGELKMDNVDYVVCHVDSLADTLKLRGLLKKNMPDRKKGTLGGDVAAMVKLFASGVEYSSTKEPGVTLYGNMKFTVGRLDMTDEQFEANITALVHSLAGHRPLEFGPIINKAFMLVDNSQEEYRIDLSSFNPKAGPKDGVVRRGKGKGAPAAKVVTPAEDLQPKAEQESEDGKQATAN